MPQFRTSSLRPHGRGPSPHAEFATSQERKTQVLENQIVAMVLSIVQHGGNAGEDMGGKQSEEKEDDSVQAQDEVEVTK